MLRPWRERRRLHVWVSEGNAAAGERRGQQVQGRPSVKTFEDKPGHLDIYHLDQFAESIPAEP